MAEPLQLARDRLFEAIEPRPDVRVLDVTGGPGGLVPEARSVAGSPECEVVTHALTIPGSAVAESNKRSDLPFPDRCFDEVISAFGVMHAHDPQRMAHELSRVCRRKGHVRIASWAPDGFFGQVYKIIGKHAPRAPDFALSTVWGTDELSTRYFAYAAAVVHPIARWALLRYPSPQHLLDAIESVYGPTRAALWQVEEGRRLVIRKALATTIDIFNHARDGTAEVPSKYVEIVVKV